MIFYEFLDEVRGAIARAEAEAMGRLRSIDPDNLRRQQGVLDGLALASTAFEEIVKRYTQ